MKNDVTNNKPASDNPQPLANGRVCCVLGLSCCIPPEGLNVEEARKSAVAGILKKLCTKLNDDDAAEIAHGLLSEFDLVPSGVGTAIAQGYSRWIKQGG